MERVRIRNRTRGVEIAHSAEVANNWLTRLRGLMGRRELAAGEGMVIYPCSSIHTFFMAFPIDVAFADSEHRVVKVVPVVPPWRIGPVAPGARYVIELPAGTLLATRTVVGDQLEWVR